MSAAPLPLTAAQLGIWLGQALDPESTAYWAAEYLELTGALDLTAFERAHARAFQEAEALRTRFTSGVNGPEQVVDEGVQLPLERLDFSAAPDPQLAARYWMQGSLTAAVSLERGGLLRSSLVCIAAERHFWLLRAHHIVLDGYAFHLLQTRVAQLYAEERSGRADSPSPSRASVADLVGEDRGYRASAAFARDREFWLGRLRGRPVPAALLPLQPLSRSTRHERGRPDADLLTRVSDAARASKVELSAWLSAAVAAWLGSELGASNVTLGLPVANRMGSVAANLPCMAMNIVPLPLEWGERTTFAELALAAQVEQRASRLHHRYRYEDLRQDLVAAGVARRPFGVVVNWMPFASPAFEGIQARKQPLSAGPVEDLAVALTPCPEGLRVDLEANPDTYDAATLARCHRALLQTLTLVAADPQLTLSELPCPESVRPALSLLDGEPLFESVQPVLSRVLRHAQYSPDAVAIESPERAPLTYAELVRNVRGLAARLADAGVVVGDRVAVLLPRSSEAVVSQLAILWLGAAYLPLDPRGPSARARGVLEDAAPKLVLVSDAAHAPLQDLATFFVGRLDGGRENFDEPRLVPHESAAYVIYTSGSTGKPNGVVVSRGALDHFVAAARQRYAFSATDRVLQFAPLAFDASVEEIMVTLASGGTLVLRSDSMIESLPGFLDQARALRLTVLDLPTAYFHELVSALADERSLPPDVRLVIIGGEAALVEHVARFRRFASATVRLLNTYGPTETTIVCTTAVLAGADAAGVSGADLPIGGPLPGVAVAVVDGEHAPVAVGREGQLCVLGPTLGNGYLGRDAVTAQRFVRLDRLRGAPRGYLTGDRVRLTAEGQLVYLGRIDEELKISGYRVSPLEVEAALVALGSVIEAAVVTTTQGGAKRLVAFVVSRDAAPSASSLRSQLADHLAPAAVPRQIAFVDRLPRDANGKIDRSRLRSRAPAPDVAPTLAASPFEQQVAEVWREVLGVEVTDLDADFFALGGHSLLALRVAERVGRALGRVVALSALFRHPTVRSLAAALERDGERPPSTTQDPLGPRIALSPVGAAPLFCLPPADGLCWCYAGLARQLPNVTLWGLQAPGLRGESPADFSGLVDHYLAELVAVQPRGPYRLLGWSSGGGLAHALAARLEARGETVALVALLDAYPADMWRGKPEPTESDAWIMMLDAEAAASLVARSSLPSRAELLSLVKQPGSSLADFDDATLVRMSEVSLASMRAYRTAQHPKARAPITFFRAAQRPTDAPDVELWRRYSAVIETIDVPATHLQMCSAASLSLIASVLAPAFNSPGPRR